MSCCSGCDVGTHHRQHVHWFHVDKWHDASRKFAKPEWMCATHEHMLPVSDFQTFITRLPEGTPCGRTFVARSKHITLKKTLLPEVVLENGDAHEWVRNCRKRRSTLCARHVPSIVASARRQPVVLQYHLYVVMSRQLMRACPTTPRICASDTLFFIFSCFLFNYIKMKSCNH